MNMKRMAMAMHTSIDRAAAQSADISQAQLH
jgi:hypothetical protein